MKRKILVALIALLVVFLSVIAYWQMKPKKEPDIISLDTNGDNLTDYQISFRGPSSLVWESLPENNKKYKFVTEDIYTYQITDNGKDAGKIILTLRQIEKKDVMYFLKYEPGLPVENLRVVITAVNEVARGGRNGRIQIKGRQLLYGKTITNTNSFWGIFDIYRTFGENLPLNAVFLDSPTHHVRLGLVDVYKPLKNMVREEHFEKSMPIVVSRVNENLNYIIPLPKEKGYFVENWGILGNSPLVDWQNPSAVNDARVGDLVRYRKLSTDGIYYLTPWNYYPTEKTAFWLNPASTYHVAGLFSKQDGGSYFRDIAISSMYSVIETQTKDFYWVSSPRSDWLYQDYGIPEGFYDTRFNTDVALYLLNMYEKTGEKMALESSSNYAEFLRKYVVEQGIATAGGGMLVPDYFKQGTGHKKTNVSLNHLVAEMNFLLKLYTVDKDFNNLKVANLIRQAVRDTGRSWIRPDGNLHYAYLGSGKFGMEDYPLITLNDLRVAQKLIQQTSENGKPDEIFQMLINAKEAFLRKNNMPIK